jgi:2-methylcitrate dehydratase PrpD
MAVTAIAPELRFDVQKSPLEIPDTVRAFMNKVTVEADDALLAIYPRSWPARVIVVAGRGTIEQAVTMVPGDPAWPFGRELVKTKFLQFALPVFGTGLAEHILEMLSSEHFELFVGTIEASLAHRLTESL